ncbi:MaoC family dehydratase (plasmid) [Halobaculum sp. CBA1158]|uniref:MaoC family dehydratase n=1 Tax=Halobaculum sp. CBA1158 TaxID=2904243 RepID=UPI001F2B656E|nr:MaoC family dehydratase [Halobaculum sp. CBA1158]UIP01512.1 MaoC family dehydratase [Halobaculum sp. CBA1158]
MTKRTFEDIEEGAVHDLGSFRAEEAEMRAFAERYDPQPIHVDPEAAADSIFGGIIASGWYTASCCMRLLVDGFFNDTVSMGAFGMEELRWKTPVRAGDTVAVELAIAKKTQSDSRDDRGYVDVDVTATNQDGEEVVYWRATNIIGTRQ